MPITLTLYRGEKAEWWPSPEYRLMYGMTLYAPWQHRSGDYVNDIWAKLVNEVNRQPGIDRGKKVAAYAQYLRASGRPFALATAWTNVGSFTSDYNYVINIPNAYLFYWGGTTGAPDIGTPIPQDEQNNVREDYIVLNAETIGASTILGFGHKTGTKEITFFHDLPIGLIGHCNGRPTSEWHIKKWSDLSFDQKIKFEKLRRR